MTVAQILSILVNFLAPAEICVVQREHFLLEALAPPHLGSVIAAFLPSINRMKQRSGKRLGHLIPPYDEFEENAAAAPSEWEQFREDDGEPISIEELKGLKLKEMPEDVSVLVLGDYFPETTLTRDGEFLVCEITEHLYTKY
jgi:hypothetical protein